MINLKEAKDRIEAGFLPGDVIRDILEERAKLEVLCQIMFDPENQPPQMTKEEAWEQFCKHTSAVTEVEDG